MIVDKIIQQKIKQYKIQEFIEDQFQKASVAGSKLQMTPLGEKVIISASRPGLVVGRRGQSIKRLTSSKKDLILRILKLRLSMLKILI